MADPDPVIAELRRRATYAAARIGAEITGELKKVLSVPAPIVPGSVPPRAATPATPGAPPRRVSGRGRAATAYVVDTSEDGSRVTLYVGNSVFYMGVHERHDHKWLEKNIPPVPVLQALFAKYFSEAR